MRLPILAILTVIALCGADTADFTGSYTRTSHKGGSIMKIGTSTELQVIQTAVAIEVTRVIDGSPNTYKVKLDGSQTPLDIAGVSKASCAARVKGKTLIVDIYATTAFQPNSPPIQLHAREKWTLSPDGKTLTVHGEADSPNVPPSMQIIQPWTEVYARN